MYGWPFMDSRAYGPPEPTQTYCHECSTSERAAPGVPCWFCGAPLLKKQPKYWPANNGPQVLNGQAYSPGEPEREEEAA